MERKLIFGSTALKYWFPNYNRKISDLDIIGEGKSSSGIEYHYSQAFEYILQNNLNDTYVDPNFLYTIKVSHISWNINFDKHMKDIIFLKNAGCNLDLVLYNLLYKDWEIIHGKKNIKLDGSPEEFFNSNITRKMNHDELHELVKFYSEPLHNKIRKDKNNVKVSKELWDSLSLEDKLKCAQEEIFVFALERFSEYPPNHAIIKATKHLITNSTKGFFNLFLIDNFEKLIYSNRDIFLNFYNTYKEI